MGISTRGFQQGTHFSIQEVPAVAGLIHVCASVWRTRSSPVHTDFSVVQCLICLYVWSEQQWRESTYKIIWTIFGQATNELSDASSLKKKKMCPGSRSNPKIYWTLHFYPWEDSGVSLPTLKEGVKRSDDAEGCLDQQTDLNFLPSDNLEDSLMDVALRLIRLIADTIAGRLWRGKRSISPVHLGPHNAADMRRLSFSLPVHLHLSIITLWVSAPALAIGFIKAPSYPRIMSYLKISLLARRLILDGNLKSMRFC